MRRHVALRRSAGERLEVRDWVRMSPVRRILWVLKLLLDPRRLRLEFNAYETSAMAAVVLRPFPVHVFLRVHSGGPEARLTPGQRRVLKRFLLRVDEVVLVGEHVRGVLSDAGYTLPVEPRIEPAFLPPPPEDEEGILDTYHPALRTFLNERSPLLTLQGSEAFRNGVDLYGADMAIELLIQLQEDYPNIGLVIGRPTPGDDHFRAYCRKLDERLFDTGLHDHVAILDGERELWPVIKRADVYLRPTLSDGDSIGVREALHLGTAVAASEVAPRPEDVHLFRSRDGDDFLRAVRAALEEVRAITPHSDSGEPCF